MEYYFQFQFQLNTHIQDEKNKKNINLCSRQSIYNVDKCIYICLYNTLTNLNKQIKCEKKRIPIFFGMFGIQRVSTQKITVGLQYQASKQFVRNLFNNREQYLEFYVRDPLHIRSLKRMFEDCFLLYIVFNIFNLEKIV